MVKQCVGHGYRVAVTLKSSNMDAIDYISQGLPYFGILWATLVVIAICFWIAGK